MSIGFNAGSGGIHNLEGNAPLQNAGGSFKNHSIHIGEKPVLEAFETHDVALNIPTKSLAERTVSVVRSSLSLG